MLRVILSRTTVSVLRGNVNNLKGLHINKATSIRCITKSKSCFKEQETVLSKHKKEEPFLLKLARKIPFIDVEKYRLQTSAYILYEQVADKINYTDFFYEFSLPDTFYTWFVITELHVWMLSVRCMAEGEDGKLVRNKIIEAMWGDVATRAKKLGSQNPSSIKRQLGELSEQFQAALISYDEGLEDDMVLAGALWRRLFQMGEVDAEHLDSLIRYIRRQLRLLDNTSSEDLLIERQLSWEKLKN